MSQIKQQNAGKFGCGRESVSSSSSSLVRRHRGPNMQFPLRILRAWKGKASGQKKGKEKGKGEEDRVRGGGEGGRGGGPFQFIRRGAISRAERQGSEIRQRVLHNFFLPITKNETRFSAVLHFFLHKLTNPPLWRGAPSHTITPVSTPFPPFLFSPHAMMGGGKERRGRK